MRSIRPEQIELDFPPIKGIIENMERIGILSCFQYKKGERDMKRVTIRVPATTANLGPGFDAFGCALSLYTDVTFGDNADAGEQQNDPQQHRRHCNANDLLQAI